MGKRKGRSGGKKWLWCLPPLGIALACGVVYSGLSLSVELAGETSLLQEYGQPYREPGVRAVLRFNPLPRKALALDGDRVAVTGAPEENRLGTYTLHYRASFLGLHGEGERRVTVIDSVCPVITLEPREGRKPAVRAVDNLDGDISGRVRCREEAGVLYYSVVDSSGNPANAQWTLPPELLAPPEIHLEGGETLSIPVGSLYSEPGYTASDAMGRDLTAAVQAEGTVIWWEPGTYQVEYSVTDSMERTATVKRSVEVVAQAWAEPRDPGAKTVYLTFDDGPGPYTEHLLDVLDRYGVKATFFVTDSGYDEVLKDIAARGHSIGIHTVTHRYQDIYASVEAYFRDLTGMGRIIQENTGLQTTLLRFPGGSSNEVSRNWCEGIMTDLSRAVQDAGYQYFDWNVDSGDAGGAATAAEVFRNVTQGIRSNRVSIVLQHDTRDFSVEAVEEILRWGKENGYRFLPLERTSPGCHHSIHN